MMMEATERIGATTPRLVSFVVLLEEASEKWYANNYPLSAARCSPYVTHVGPKYIRIVHDSSCRGFVDRETGDIYYPASYQGPGSKATRRVRGNIYDADNGAKCVRWYGVARADDMAGDR